MQALAAQAHALCTFQLVLMEAEEVGGSFDLPSWVTRAFVALEDLRPLYPADMIERLELRVMKQWAALEDRESSKVSTAP